MPIIIVETYVKASVERCFDAARDIELHQKTVWSHTREEAIAGVVHGLIEFGQTVTFKATHFGVRQLLTSKITDYNRPHQFTDSMQKGAFKRLKHTHEFMNQGKGTLMKDTLEFQSPYGVIGLIVDAVILKHYMKKFISDRNQQLKVILESQ